jgi:hypothetical protein
MGAITPLIFPSLATSGPTPLAYLPLVLIPTYFVPSFTVLHLVALIQAQHARWSWKDATCDKDRWRE